MITLGIDCGTQSTRVLALDLETGGTIAQAASSYGMCPGLPGGHAEQDPAWWVEALEMAMEEVLHQLGERRERIIGIGVSGQQHGFVPLDEKHRVIRPAKLWCDTSTTEECRLFSEAFEGKSGLIARTGLDMLPGYTAPKILWFKRNEPGHFAALAHVLLPHDYLNFYLSGTLSMEYGDASGTALMDVRSRRWSSELCNFIDASLEAKLPQLTSSRVPHGILRGELAKSWRLPEGITVSAGGGDNMMGAIGTGNVRPGRVTASLGTSGTIYAYSPQAVVDPEGEIAAFCDSTDGWLPLFCTMNATAVTEQVRALFGWSHEEFESAAASVAPGADGLFSLPYFQGERTPNLPHATGSFHGLTLHNCTPQHLARATMEGVTLTMAYGLNRLRSLGVSPSEIRLIGGGSRSPFWRQLCADIFQTRVTTLQNGEGAALGAAIQAAAAVLPEKSVEGWSDAIVKLETSESCEPSSSLADLYGMILAKQQKMTQTIYPHPSKMGADFS